MPLQTPLNGLFLLYVSHNRVVEFGDASEFFGEASWKLSLFTSCHGRDAPGPRLSTEVSAAHTHTHTTRPQTEQ